MGQIISDDGNDADVALTYLIVHRSVIGIDGRAPRPGPWEKGGTEFAPALPNLAYVI